MSVTLTDVAKAAGVSVATASRALTNSDHPVAPVTRQKVLMLAEQMGYRPNLVARSLRTDATMTVGIIVENILSPFIPPIVKGIQSYLVQQDYVSIIVNADWDLEAEAQGIQSLIKRQIDGIIFVESLLRKSDALPDLGDRPHVFVDRLFDSLCENSVVPDDYYGARLATKHLLELGHRRIGYVNGPQGWDAARNRLNGYRQEMEAWDIPFDPELVDRGDWQVKSGYLAAGRLLQLQTPPTAIFAGNDLMALGVIYAAQEAGLRVPRDIAVVGYDNREFAGFMRPAITTVRLPCEELGRVSAELFLNLCHGCIEASAPIYVRGDLIVRDSCGAREEAWEFEPERGEILHRRNGKRCE
jgi:DNA-binding LacI/PurR family transcriptional regulator